MIAALLTEIFFGGLTGYITNDVAIKTLFKPGGTIEKTRAQFTKEIAALLEEEILTPTDLAEILHREEVEQALSDAIAAFCAQLPQALSDVTLNDLDNGILAQHINEQAASLAKDAQFQQTLDTSLEKCLSPKLAADFAQLLRTYFIPALKEAPLSVLNDTPLLVRENTAEAKKELQIFAAELSRRILSEPELLADFNKAFAQSNLWQNIIDALGARSIAEYFSVAPNDAASIQSWLTSPQMRPIFANFAFALHDELKKSPLYVHQLLNMPPVRAILLIFLEKQWPEIICLLLQWLSTNKPLFVQMLDQAINEALTTQEGISAILSKLIHDFLGNGEKFSAEFLQKAHTFLTETLSSAQLLEHLCAEDSPWGGLRLADLAAKISAAQIEGLLLYFLPEIFTHSAKINAYLTAPLMDFIHLPDMKQFNLAKYLTESNLTSLLARGLNLLFDTLTDKPLAEICPDYAGKVQNIAANSLLDLADEQLAHIISRYLSGLIMQKLPQAGTFIGNFSLGKLLGIILTPEHTEKLLPALRVHLQEFLQAQIPGRLAPLAEKSLNTLSNEDLRQLVRDFMGRELKPLNYLGAAMGAIAGLGAGAASLALANPLNIAYASGKLALFGAVGYTTNCGAVKGLFWPYKPVANIRAIQGVIPKRQADFSQALGTLFTRYVLNPNSLQNILQSEQDKLQEVLQQNIVNINPARLACPLNRAVTADFGARYCAGHTLSNYLPALDNTTVARYLDAENILPLAFKQLNTANITSVFSAVLPSILTKAGSLSLRALKQEETLAAFNDSLAQKAAQIDLMRLSEHAAAGFSCFSEHTLLEIAPAAEKTLQPFIAELIPALLNSLCSYLAEHLAELTTFVQKMIKNRLNMLQAFGYAAMNGDQLVEKVLSIFIMSKLPAFCGLKTTELEAVAKDRLHDFCAASFQDNGICLDKDIFYLLLSSSAFQTALKRTADNCTQNILDTPLSKLIPASLVNEREHLIQDDMQKLLAPLAAICAHALVKIDYAPLCRTIKIDERFKASVADELSPILSAFLKKLNSTSIAALLPTLQNPDNIEILLTDFISSEGMQDIIAAEKTAFKNYLPEYLPLLSAPLSHILTQLLLDNVQIYGQVLDKMQLSDFIAAQTAALKPEELEKMVRGFGQGYLSHIQNMGWWGAVFAIPGILLDFFI